MRRSLGPVLLIALGLLLVLLFFVLRGRPAEDVPDDATRPHVADSQPAGLPRAPTPQPVAPTATAVPTNSDPTATASVTSTHTPTPAVTPDTRHCPLPDCLARSGVSGRQDDIAAASGAGLPFGTFFDWWATAELPAMAGYPAGDQPRYWLMVPATPGGPGLPWSEIEELIGARPGSIWIIGNEPDVAWQDNITAETYATLYHDLYTFIKERDPAASIAIAGVAQPSPLRFAYLEQVLATYQDLYGEMMPVDIWTIHAFILREQANSWGVGIPPGIDAEEGLLYEIADHTNLDIFQQSLVSFRLWMRDQGYGGKPLAVTEFGVLHPADFGFPPDVVTAFMIDAIDFMATATGETGDPNDDYRLVQQWFWYSVYDGRDFPTGNLYDPVQDSLTAAGQAFRRYLEGR